MTHQKVLEDIKELKTGSIGSLFGCPQPTDVTQTSTQETEMTDTSGPTETLIKEWAQQTDRTIAGSTSTPTLRRDHQARLIQGGV